MKSKLFNHAILCLCATLATAYSARAQAQDIVFDSAPTADEHRVLDPVYGKFLKANPGISLHVAQASLQKGGPKSVFVRFVGAQTCGDGDRCETAVLRYDGASWHSVFEHSAHTISLAAPATLPGSAGMASLVIDGGERWIWTGMDHYLPDISSIGQLFPASTTADNDVARSAQAAMLANPDICPSRISGRLRLTWEQVPWPIWCVPILQACAPMCWVVRMHW